MSGLPKRIQHKRIKGWLHLAPCGEGDKCLAVLDLKTSVDDIILYEWFNDHLVGKCVTVRYYVCDKEMSVDEALEAFLGKLYGAVDTEYGAVYSETTGYLWFDDKFSVGGHNLRDELVSYVGKYLILLVTIEEEAPSKK